MPDPSNLRDSTQIVLPTSTLEGIRTDLEEQFTVTITERDNVARIIGSPVVIKEVSEYLTRQGISLP
jgi:hypothetical protein